MQAGTDDGAGRRRWEEAPRRASDRHARQVTATDTSGNIRGWRVRPLARLRLAWQQARLTVESQRRRRNCGGLRRWSVAEQGQIERLREAQKDIPLEQRKKLLPDLDKDVVEG